MTAPDLHVGMTRGTVVTTLHGTRPVRFTGLVLTTPGDGRWVPFAWCGHAHRTDTSAGICADALVRQHNRRTRALVGEA